MRVAIVDDIERERALLRAFFERYAQEKALSVATVCFPTGDALLRDYTPDFDILVLDIDMPGTNGLDVARQIRQTDEQVGILFVTQIAQYAIHGYEVGAVDYIVKPITYPDFAMKLYKALRRIHAVSRDLIAVNSTTGLHQLHSADIFYLESQAHYLIYYTRPGQLSVRGNMNEHEALLRPHGFRRCHRSYLVNLSYVERLQAPTVTVHGQDLPWGRKYRDSLITEFMRFVRGALT